jgi:DNA-binding GntR family transcriptional regulator
MHDTERRPPFEQVADALREAIMAGELTPGDRLPSYTEMNKHFDITVTTAQRSLRILKNEGLVEGRQGKGLFVCDIADRTVAIPIGRPEVIAEILRREMKPQHFAALLNLLNAA